jgi:hypothetical protein
LQGYLLASPLGTEHADALDMTRFTAPLTLAVFAIAIPLLALLAMANGETEWDEADDAEPCSLT